MTDRGGRLLCISFFIVLFSCCSWWPTTAAEDPKGPAIRPANDFNVTSDAIKLHSAFTGWGTQEEKIIEIITKRSWEQRQLIQEKYKQLYKKALVSDMDSETSGNFRKALRGMLQTNQSEFLAYEIHDILDSFWTDKDALTQIICGLDKHELLQVGKEYNRLYGKSLSGDLEHKLSGKYAKFLATIVEAKRSSSLSKFKDNAAILKSFKKKGFFGRKTINEDTVGEVLSKLSLQNIQKVAEEYRKQNSESLVAMIKGHVSDPLKTAYLAVLQIAGNGRTYYFANCLITAFEGFFTKTDMIRRIFISRSELDLLTIAKQFSILTGDSIRQFIKDKTRSDFELMLLAFIPKNI